MADEELPAIRDKQDSFPCCLVWTPIPLITWLLPFVGHMGICTSRGTILDFAGPYYIGVGNMAFGSPTRYVQLEPAKAMPEGDAASSPELLWDTALQASARAYQQHNYNLMGDNCHAFCAHCLNSVGYGASRRWNMVHLAAMVFIRGRYVSCWGAAKQWLPFCIIMPVGLYFGTWMFAVAWAGGLVLPLMAWFMLYNHVLSKPAVAAQ